ncbi:hypothetical protein ON010_g3102 [Phytophthora cinnamomi]|nr:hypothetical protein ON010_g3102 [Phytophthora cinnamomi]
MMTPHGCGSTASSSLVCIAYPSGLLADALHFNTVLFEFAATTDRRFVWYRTKSSLTPPRPSYLSSLLRPAGHLKETADERGNAHVDEVEHDVVDVFCQIGTGLEGLNEFKISPSSTIWIGCDSSKRSAYEKSSRSGTVLISPLLVVDAGVVLKGPGCVIMSSSSFAETGDSTDV